ncbi:MAG TPA: cache domain-containing protein [Candidatus Acidoferrum sp.]|nr:cache domain-containing protein [Candidatus Acidoferrum sp.]
MAERTRTKASRASFWDWSIRTKLVVFALLLSIVPILLASVVASLVFTSNARQRALSSMLHEGQASTQLLDARLSEGQAFVKVLGLDPALVSFAARPADPAARDAASRLLRAATEKDNYYESIAIVEKTGKIILSSLAGDIGSDVRVRPYFQKAMQGVAYTSEPSVSIITNKPAIFYSAPIQDSSGQVVAVVRIRASLDDFAQVVDRDAGTEGVGSYGMLLDEYGIRLAISTTPTNRAEITSKFLYRAISPVPPEAEKAMVAEKRFGRAAESNVGVLSIPALVPALQSPTDLAILGMNADLNSERNIGYAVRMRNKPWRYVLVTPQSTFYAETYRLQLTVLLIGLGSAILAAGVGIYVGRTISSPLLQLVRVADRMSLGDLDAKIELGRKDEIGLLGESLSRMQASLRAAMERLRAKRT